MSIHLLPTLDGGNINSPTLTAFWETQPEILLEQVGNGIAVDGTAQTREISSIPDVWARAVLFRTALASETHPAHARVVREWRGMLSLLALRDLYALPIGLTPVSISESAANGAARAFARALISLSPAPIPFEQGALPYAWTDTVLITYDNTPIGAISPGTLVYTANGYQEVLKGKGLDLVDDDTGALLAPSVGADPSTAHYVAEWVYRFSERIKPLVTADPAAQMLTTLLRKWLEELAPTLGYTGGNPVIDAPGVAYGSVPVGITPQAWPPLQRTGIYQALFTPLMQAVTPGAIDLASRSTLFLRGHRDALLIENKGQAVKGVVVIHEDTLTPSAQVWGVRKMSSLGREVSTILSTHFNAPSGDKIGDQNLSDEGAIWIRPERYFLTDTLVAPREGQYVLGTGEWVANGGGKYLLPFRKELLELFSAEDVAPLLQPTFLPQPDGSVEFSFQLPIGTLPQKKTQISAMEYGSDEPTTVVRERQTMIRVKRVYRTVLEGDPLPGEGRLIKERLPVMELFPRYLGKVWRRYYLFQSDAHAFTATPYAPNAKVAASQPREAKIQGVTQKATVTEMYGEDAFPEGIVLRKLDPHTQSQHLVGLLLTPRDAFSDTGLNDTLTVGIDFGTSNTNVYSKRSVGGVSPWKVDFPAHLRPLTTQVDEHSLSDQSTPARERRNLLLAALFVPNRVVEFPMPTLLNITVSETDRKESKGRMLLDWFPYFPTSYAWPQTVKYNLKWIKESQSATVSARRVTKEFLDGIIYMMLLGTTKQRIQNIVIRCTYPKSFSENEKTTLQNEWDAVFRSISDGGEHALLNDAKGAIPALTPPKFLDEGSAAAVYFSTDEAIGDPNLKAFKQRAVCIDVGGGTTDVAILFGADGDVVMDTSIRLAGAAIAEFIKGREGMQRLLFSADAQASLLRAKSENNEALFGAILNSVLRAEDADIRERLRQESGHSEVGHLRRLIALNFGAIVFHVGTMLAAAERAGAAPGLREEVKREAISLHWGGNASRLISWIDFGNTATGNVAPTLFNNLLYYALEDHGFEINHSMLRQAQSPLPKAEAAGGVVVATKLEAQGGGGNAGGGPIGDFSLQREKVTVAKTLGAIAGESVTLRGGTQLTPYDEITKETLFDDRGTLIESVSGERMRRFLELFNGIGEHVGLLTPDTRVPSSDSMLLMLASEVKAAFVNIAASPKGERYIEPLFIAEVRPLLKRLTQNA